MSTAAAAVRSAKSLAQADTRLGALRYVSTHGSPVWGACPKPLPISFEASVLPP
jgi:hypothetical protein